MKPEQSEQFLIEELINQSIEAGKISDDSLMDIDKLTGDASTRRYYRARTNSESYVVCLDNPSRKGERNRFLDVQDFLFNNGVRVPVVYDSLLNRGYILEEDLGDETLLKKLATINDKKEEYSIYQDVLDILVSIQKIDENLVNSSKLFTESFDVTKLMSEVEFSTKFFIDCFLKIKDEGLKEAIHQCYRPICEKLASAKMLLTHRDFHSRNIMVHNDDNIVIDFQDARMGIPQYDLVSLLEDCYYKIDDANKEKLIDYYISKINLSYIQQTNDQFQDQYNAMALQRVFKAIGSFAYIYEGRKDLRYIKYIGYAMERLKHYLFKNPDYNELRKILFKVYYAN